MNKFLLPVILAIITCLSCTTTEQIACEPGNIEINLTGFADSDLDSSIVIAYEAGTFSRMIDTLVVAAAGAGNDTLSLTFLDKRQYRTIANHHPRVGCDYRLYIPKLNRWYDIANIILAGNTHQTITRRKNDGKFYFCTNPVVSCTLDNIRVMIMPVSIDAGKLFISK